MERDNQNKKQPQTLTSWDDITTQDQLDCNRLVNSGLTKLSSRLLTALTRIGFIALDVADYSDKEARALIADYLKANKSDGIRKEDLFDD